MILEFDGNVIAGRVAMRGADADVPLSEQVLSNSVLGSIINQNVVISSFHASCRSGDSHSTVVVCRHYHRL